MIVDRIVAAVVVVALTVSLIVVGWMLHDNHEQPCDTDRSEHVDG